MTRFMCSSSSINGSKMVIIGAPVDYTCSRSPGTRKGPDVIREESWNIESYSPSLEMALEDRLFYDLGNISFPIGDVSRSLENIEQVSSMLFNKGKKVLLLGGEHLVSYPVIKAASSFYKNLCVIHFDAHADLRKSYHGGSLSHASVMRLVAENCLKSGKDLHQFGIRSGTREEFEWGFHNTCLSSRLPDREQVEDLFQEIKGRPVYISIDIDVFDPSVAPGTGTPEPGGVNSSDFLNVFYEMNRFDVIGFDIVEVSPLIDHNGITSLLGAKIAREGILLWS